MGGQGGDTKRKADGRGQPLGVNATMRVSAGVPSPDVSGDGRLARGERTRQRVAEALIDLLEEGKPQPTAKQIAAQAGVSLRLVFHHFEDMEALYRVVSAMQFQRHWSSLHPVPAGSALHHRIDGIVHQRMALFEAVSPVRRSAISQSQRSSQIALDLAESNAHLRDQLVMTFESEIEASGRPEELLDALDLVASWESWDRLRTVQRLPARAAARVVTEAMARILGGES